MQRIINYGSFLQAYGLKKNIENLGYQVEFIDYKYEKTINENKKSFIKRLTSNSDISWYVKRKNFSKKFEKNFKEYLKIIGITDEKKYSKNIDNLVIGSDEVFNCMQGYPVGYSRNLFGYEYENINTLSYAASFGYTKMDAIREKNIYEELGNMLKRFKAISVRDMNSYDIITELTDKKPTINLDPVLITDFSEDIEKYSQFDVRSLENYIILYAYTERISKEEGKIIKKFAKANNKKIVSIGFPQKIADINLDCNPFDMLKIFKNADFIITDTFHGTIFSIISRAKFCTIIRKSNYNKLHFLLNKLQLSNREIHDLEKLNEFYNERIDYEETFKIIDKEKRNSMEYLTDNLI